MTLALFFADRCGKQRRITGTCRRALLTAAATEHKDDSLDKIPHLIEVKYFDEYAYRIVIIYSPEHGVYAYMLERFDLISLSWKQCYDAARGFNDKSDLYDDIKECFDNVIFDE